MTCCHKEFNGKEIGEKERVALDAALSRLELNCSDEVKEKLLLHLALVFKKNQELNLTRIINFNDAIIDHIEDSLSIYPEIKNISGTILDLGTGAGFPGIPLALYSKKEFYLLDSVKKKARAVKDFVSQLGIENFVHVFDLRSEEMASKRSASFSGVVMRAVSQTPVCMELAAPLLEQLGRLILLKSDISDTEEQAGLEAAKILGLEPVHKHSLTIGDKEKRKRSIFVFKKVKEPEIKLPRRPGMAAKRPLVSF